VFSYCPLAGSIDSLGDGQLDEMWAEVFLEQERRMLAGMVSG